MILEDIQSKFESVLVGHDVLHKKIDTVYQDLGEKVEMNTFKIDALNQKIAGVDAKLPKKIDGVEKSLKKEINRVEQKVDAVATDLPAHRADTEVHRTIYNKRFVVLSPIPYHHFVSALSSHSKKL